MQGQFGLSAVIFEGYRQQRFRLGRVTFRIRPDIGADESLRLDDLAIHTLLPKVSTVVRAQVKPIGAAASEIHLDDAAREALRTHPADPVIGLGPGLPDKRARCIKEARDYQLKLPRLNGGVTSCGHFSSPSPSVHADRRPTDLNSA